MARPTKLTPELIERIEGLLDQGLSVKSVCRELGIVKQTFYNWRNEARRLQELVAANQNPNAIVTPGFLDLWQLLQALTRVQARVHARQAARVEACLRTWLAEHPEQRARQMESELQQEMEKPQTVHYLHFETRLRKDEDGKEIPYRHEEMRSYTVERRVADSLSDIASIDQYIQQLDRLKQHDSRARQATPTPDSPR